MLDNEIIELYFARSEAAIARTAEKYGDYCYTVAHNILPQHEDAEECVNDTWLAAWNSIPPKRPDVLRLFLARITRSRAINRWHMLRAEKRGGGETAAVLDELEECVSGGSGPEQEAAANELSACIDAFLRTLPEKDRAMFVRRYFFTEPVSEIARRFGVNEGNVSVRLHRVRAKLKKHLQAEGFEP